MKVPRVMTLTESFDFGVQFDLSNSEKWYSHGPQHITKHAYANPLLPGHRKDLCSLDAFEEQAFAGKPRILTCKMLDTFSYLLMQVSAKKKVLVPS